MHRKEQNCHRRDFNMIARGATKSVKLGIPVVNPLQKWLDILGKIEETDKGLWLL